MECGACAPACCFGRRLGCIITESSEEFGLRFYFPQQDKHQSGGDKKSFLKRHRQTVKRKQKGNQKMGYFAVGVAVPKLAWGASVNGMSTSQLKSRRAMIHAYLTRNPRGRSVTIDCALSEHRPTTIDPIYCATSSPIMSLSNAIWDGWVSFAWIATLWTSSFARAIAPDGSPQWSRAADGLQLPLCHARAGSRPVLGDS